MTNVKRSLCPARCINNDVRTGGKTMSEMLQMLDELEQENEYDAEELKET